VASAILYLAAATQQVRSDRGGTEDLNCSRAVLWLWRSWQSSQVLAGTCGGTRGLGKAARGGDSAVPRRGGCALLVVLPSVAGTASVARSPVPGASGAARFCSAGCAQRRRPCWCRVRSRWCTRPSVRCVSPGTVCLGSNFWLCLFWSSVLLTLDLVSLFYLVAPGLLEKKERS